MISSIHFHLKFFFFFMNLTYNKLGWFKEGFSIVLSSCRTYQIASLWCHRLDMWLDLLFLPAHVFSWPLIISFFFLKP